MSKERIVKISAAVGAVVALITVAVVVFVKGKDYIECDDRGGV